MVYLKVQIVIYFKHVYGIHQQINVKILYLKVLHLIHVKIIHYKHIIGLNLMLMKVIVNNVYHQMFKYIIIII